VKRILPWLLIPLILGLFVAIAYLPLPVPPYLDFQVVYHAGMGLLRGIPLYDHARQVKMIADLAGVQPEHVFVLPFPYPPWYALVAVPLVLLPITVAARVWLELNLSMLMLSIFMLTEGWRPWKRLVAFPIAMIFLPVLGTLFVGQYTFPVLLGMALFVYAIRKEKPLLVALAAALLTFKPHLGGLMLCAGFAHLWLRRDAFGRNALRATIFTGAFLFVVGFLADPLWPLHYLYSLVEFRSIEAVSSCDLCASMPVILSNLTGSGGIRLPFWLAGGLLSTFVWLLYKQGQKVFLSPTWLVAALSLVTLLSSPYLLNYDFLLLLLPLFFLIDRAGTWWEWSLIGAVYLIPWLGLGLFGRQGNITLILSALLLAGWLYQHIAKNTA
jgi:hypothetical protein